MVAFRTFTIHDIIISPSRCYVNTVRPQTPARGFGRNGAAGDSTLSYEFILNGIKKLYEDGAEAEQELFIEHQYPIYFFGTREMLILSIRSITRTF